MSQPGPTVSVFFPSDDSEVVTVDCRHGRSQALHLGGDGESLRRTIHALLAACDCGPATESVQLWDSLAYAIGMLERDLAAAPPRDPLVADFAALTLTQRRSHRCLTCDPHLIETTRLGVVKVETFHDEACSTFASRGPNRKATWVELGARA